MQNDQTRDVAIVTGASGGIGTAVATRLAEDGAAVVAFDRTGAEQLAETINRSGGVAIGCTGDVTRPADWQSVLAVAGQKLGNVSVLVNVAGIHLEVDTVADTSLADFDQTLDVNLRGPWIGMSMVIPRMISAGHGVVVNVTSSAARQGVPNHAAYSASKGGLEALSRQAAVEYAPAGVRINSIAPGAIDTPLLSTNSPDANDAIKAAIPLRSIGTPDEVAALVSYLLSPSARYVVGAAIPIDGGLTAG